MIKVIKSVKTKNNNIINLLETQNKNYEKTILIIGVFHGEEPQGEFRCGAETQRPGGFPVSLCFSSVEAFLHLPSIITPHLFLLHNSVAKAPRGVKSFPGGNSHRRMDIFAMALQKI